MLIGIEGATCSGKTRTIKSLERLLSKTEYSYKIIPEVARELFKETGYESLRDLIEIPMKYIEFERNIITKQIELEKKYSEKYDIVVTDRTLYSCLLYACRFINEPFVNQIVEVFKPNNYDLIFLLDPIKPVDDEFRVYTETQNFQHLMIKNILPHYIEIPYMPSSERAKIILEYILNRMCPLHKHACDCCLFYDPKTKKCTFPKHKFI